MQFATWFWLETWGAFTESITLQLGPNTNGYLGEASVTLKDGGDYAHIYVAEVCTLSGGQRLCGIIDEPGGRALGIFASDTDTVTYALHTTGGHHVAEGVIYSL